MKIKIEMFVLVELILIIQGIFLYSWSNNQLNFWLIFYIPLTFGIGFLLCQLFEVWDYLIIKRAVGITNGNT